MSGGPSFVRQAQVHLSGRTLEKRSTNEDTTSPSDRASAAASRCGLLVHQCQSVKCPVLTLRGRIRVVPGWKGPSVACWLVGGLHNRHRLTAVQRTGSGDI